MEQEPAAKRGEGADPTAARAWTLEAAMEPLPPLAPPPALPGDGVAVPIARPVHRGPGPRTAVATVLAILVLTGVILVLVLVLPVGR